MTARRLVPSLAGQVRALSDARKGRLAWRVFHEAAGRPYQRPRVVLVAHDINEHGGMERTLAELLKRGRREADFVVIAGRVARELRPLCEWHRVPLPQRPFPLKFCWFFVGAGARLLRARGDLIHTMGAIVPNRVDVVGVHFCHAGFRSAAGGLSPPGAPPLRAINTRIARVLALAAERWSYRAGRTRVFAAVSQGIARELRLHYPGVPVRVTPNGVDVDRFRPDQGVRAAVRGEHNVRPDEVVALFVGGDWDRKGLGIALQALAAAKEEVSAIRLWVVGSGDIDRFRRQARALCIHDQVEFLGPRAATERYYQAADVFLFPTLYEAFPLAGLEAAAAGLPIIATAVNGMEELLGPGEAGIIAAREGPATGEALARLAKDKDRRDEMGRAARERARRFTWDTSVHSVVDVYSSLGLAVRGATAGHSPMRGSPGAAIE